MLQQKFREIAQICSNIFCNNKNFVKLEKKQLVPDRVFPRLKIFCFSPKEGVHGVIDAHGLALVTACGTLHSGQRCCGTFHQQFGLIRDPNTEGNNWKIKITNATLVSKEAVSETPQLTTHGESDYPKKVQKMNILFFGLPS